MGGVNFREKLEKEPDLVELIRTRYVPLAVNQSHIGRGAKGAEADFIRKVEAQRENGSGGDQAVYIFNTAGKLLEKRRWEDKDMRSKLEASLANFHPPQAPRVWEQWKDSIWPPVPQDVIVVRLTKKYLDDPTYAGQSYDNMWIRKSEAEALALGTIPASLKRRMAQFHLIHAYCGAGMWQESDIKEVTLNLQDGRLTGHVVIEAPEHAFKANLYGLIEAKDGQLIRFDIVAKGSYVTKSNDRSRGTNVGIKGNRVLGISFLLVKERNEQSRVPPGVCGGGSSGMMVEYEEYLR